MTQPPVDETQYVPDGVGAPACADRLGRYRVLGRLGTGATGAVYRAHDGDRLVAVKVLGASNDASVRMRFLNESRAISSVSHANILAVHETGTEGDAPYIVMELATGTLRDVMRARKLDVEAVRTIGIQIASALAAAHAAQILHRDVKPANILLASEPGSWKLGDFGIARLPDSTLTDTGQFLGSPSYAAPESLRAGQFTPASDVYALAATLYEAIAGAPPHGEHDMPSVVRKLSEDAIPLRLRCPVAPALADTIMSGLARDPAQRPTAADFARRLADEPLVAETPAPPAPAASRKLRRIAIVSAIFAACFLGLAIARTRTPSKAAPVVHEAKRVDKGKTPKPAPKKLVPAQPDAGPIDDETARMLQNMERDARREMERVHGKRRRGRRGN